jgi:hypothetical protein
MVMVSVMRVTYALTSQTQISETVIEMDWVMHVTSVLSSQIQTKLTVMVMV